MFNRSKFLLILGIDSEEWADRYGISPFSCPCIRCNHVLTTSVPFAYNELRGLISPRCICGDEHPPYCIIFDHCFDHLIKNIKKKNKTRIARVLPFILKPK